MPDFTLNKLAEAMRGMPRDARIMLKLPDGWIVDLDHVKPILAGDIGTMTTDISASGSGRYTILLVASFD